MTNPTMKELEATKTLDTLRLIIGDTLCPDFWRKGFISLRDALCGRPFMYYSYHYWHTELRN